MDRPVGSDLSPAPAGFGRFGFAMFRGSSARVRGPRDGFAIVVGWR